ncbi:type IV pilin [Methanoregula sp. UBA64]|jgi:archaeal type IV pilus assembly protein PilA|uniref:type IV pilin n=1 Tax=Methanoregula sp. UBA64 TaxID=1915554 RepID=UPI0025E478FF|nr:type IV pilin [Methanoregula sp. UBA64]
MIKRSEHAVSPVVGVMLMLVVVIIIAAIVSAFAGGLVGGAKKTSQATLTGKFSMGNGFEITHAGGDPLALQNTRFVIRDGPTFGTGLEQKTAEVLNKSIMLNTRTENFASNETAFLPGDTLWISGANTTCSMLQPVVNTYGDSTLCLNNANNIGKTFFLEVSDTGGNLISKTEVTITA